MDAAALATEPPSNAIASFLVTRAVNHSRARKSTTVTPRGGTMAATMVGPYRERLLRAMAHAKLDSVQLAEKMQITYQAVRKVISGGSNSFSAANNRRAAAACGVRSDWLADETGPMVFQELPTANHQAILTGEYGVIPSHNALATCRPEERALLDALGTIPPEALAVIAQALANLHAPSDDEVTARLKRVAKTKGNSSGSVKRGVRGTAGDHRD